MQWSLNKLVHASRAYCSDSSRMESTRSHTSPFCLKISSNSLLNATSALMVKPAIVCTSLKHFDLLLRMRLAVCDSCVRFRVEIVNKTNTHEPFWNAGNKSPKNHNLVFAIMSSSSGNKKAKIYDN